ncbi:MAG: hypothetical protein HXS44_09475 [Theionarchaea archaeon]|nr:hypothetical protein [Theionarchaea archaeon]
MMVEIHEITDSEKELLHVLGKFPEISLKELVNYTKYKRCSSIIKKLTKLKENHIIFGPLYHIDFGKLSKNSLCRLHCVVETDLEFKPVIKYLQIIEPLILIYPVLSPYRKVLNVEFLSSNNSKMVEIFQLLKVSNIISDFIIRKSQYKRIIENPNLYGEFNPSLDHVLAPCEFPDMSCGCHDTIWNTCDIAILPYLMRGYKETKLIEIARAEKKVNRIWKYDQIKYSRKKMVECGLIKKEYTVNPFSPVECVHFFLFLKCDDILMTERILYNFARDERVYKEYTLFNEWGLITCFSHPRFLSDLMNKLDSIDVITEKELYQLRALPPRKYWILRLPELRYYDVDTQRLEYPYAVYREKIKEKLENEGR